MPAQLAKLTISSVDLVTIGRLMLLESANRSTVEAAHVLLRQAAGAGNKDGDYWIGRSILKKPAMFGAEGRAKAIASLERAVGAGHGSAAAALAEAYRYGIGVEPSLRTAAEFYDRAISGGRSAESITAMLDYASMLRKEGDAQDAAKAVELYQRAADKGSVEASVVLGRMFLEGREVQARRDRGHPPHAARHRAGQHGRHDRPRRSSRGHAEPPVVGGSGEAVRRRLGAPGLPRLEPPRQPAPEPRRDGKARELLESAAQKGSLDAALRLVGLEAGAGRLDAARRWKAAADAAAGPSVAKKVRIAAQLLKTGQGELRAEALASLASLTDAGDLDATVLLGRTFLAGQVPGADPAKGLELLERAADQGSNDGRLALAEALRRGQGTAVDHPRAVAAFAAVLEADPTHVAAALALARASRAGRGRAARRRPRDGLLWTGRQARQHGGDGSLGSAYAEGIGVARDPALAELWLRRATEADDVAAVEALAQFYASGAAGRPAAELAYNEYLRAARLGSSKAMVAIGRLLLAGSGVEQDTAAALEWMRRAAADNVDAKVELARLYSMGGVMRKDIAAARDLLSSAAQAGHASAMHRLGLMLSQPDAAEYDRGAALQWLEKAVAAGQDSALRDLQRLRGTGKAK